MNDEEKKTTICIFSLLELVSSFLTEQPKETFPLLHIDLIEFIQKKMIDARRYHYLDLISAFIDELSQQYATLWSVIDIQDIES
jgi:hypothetical protein